MRKNFMEIIFILDRSGSMGGLEKDVIGGFNAFIEKQKEQKVEGAVTLVLFDDKTETVFDRENLRTTPRLGEDKYYVRGSTALYDAVGRTVAEAGQKLAALVESERPDRVIVAVTTDGFENASREYTQKRVRGMIEHQKQKYNWEFLFLGANIDAEQVAGGIGIGRERAANFAASAEGVQYTFDSVAKAVCMMRAGETVSEEWKAGEKKGAPKRPAVRAEILPLMVCPKKDK